VKVQQVGMGGDAVRYGTVRRYAMLCYAMLCYAMPCYAGQRGRDAAEGVVGGLAMDMDMEQRGPVREVAV
jgi:hypothetical protein